MRINHVLVDYENVPVASLSLINSEPFRVHVFLGPNNTKLPVTLVLAVHGLGNRGEYVLLETAGKNALDFHMAYYLGALATTDPTAFFHIISKDTGFDALIQHLQLKGIHVKRSATIEEMPCLLAPSFPESDKIKTPHLELLLQRVITDLNSRKAAKPRTTKALMNTLHATCGKDLPISTIEAVYQLLIQQEYVKVQGSKMSYALGRS